MNSQMTLLLLFTVGRSLWASTEHVSTRHSCRCSSQLGLAQQGASTERASAHGFCQEADAGAPSAHLVLCTQLQHQIDEQGLHAGRSGEAMNLAAVQVLNQGGL